MEIFLFKDTKLRKSACDMVEHTIVEVPDARDLDHKAYADQLMVRRVKEGVSVLLLRWH